MDSQHIHRDVQCNGWKRRHHIKDRNLSHKVRRASGSDPTGIHIYRLVYGQPEGTGIRISEFSCIHDCRLLCAHGWQPHPICRLVGSHSRPAVIYVRNTAEHHAYIQAYVQWWILRIGYQQRRRPKRCTEDCNGCTDNWCPDWRKMGEPHRCGGYAESACIRRPRFHRICIRGLELHYGFIR